MALKLLRNRFNSSMLARRNASASDANTKETGFDDVERDQVRPVSWTFSGEVSDINVSPQCFASPDADQTSTLYGLADSASMMDGAAEDESISSLGENYDEVSANQGVKVEVDFDECQTSPAKYLQADLSTTFKHIRSTRKLLLSRPILQSSSPQYQQLLNSTRNWGNFCDRKDADLAKQLFSKMPDGVGSDLIDVSEAMQSNTHYSKVDKPACKLETLLDRRMKFDEVEGKQRAALEQQVAWKVRLEQRARLVKKDRENITTSLAPAVKPSTEQSAAIRGCDSLPCHSSNSGQCYTPVYVHSARKLQLSVSDGGAFLGLVQPDDGKLFPKTQPMKTDDFSIDPVRETVLSFSSESVLSDETIERRDNKPSVDGVFMGTTVSTKTFIGGEIKHAGEADTESTSVTKHADETNTESPSISKHANETDTESTSIARHADETDTESTSIAKHADETNTESTSIYKHADETNTESTSIAKHADGTNTESTSISKHADETDTESTSIAKHADGTNTESTSVTKHAGETDTESTSIAMHAGETDTESTSITKHAGETNTESTSIAKHADETDTESTGITKHADEADTESTGITKHAGETDTESTGVTRHAGDSNTESTGVTKHAGEMDTESTGITKHAGDNAGIHRVVSTQAVDPKNVFGFDSGGSKTILRGEGVLSDGSEATGRGKKASLLYSASDDVQQVSCVDGSHRHTADDRPPAGIVKKDSVVVDVPVGVDGDNDGDKISPESITAMSDSSLTMSGDSALAMEPSTVTLSGGCQGKADSTGLKSAAHKFSDSALSLSEDTTDSCGDCRKGRLLDVPASAKVGGQPISQASLSSKPGTTLSHTQQALMQAIMKMSTGELKAKIPAVRRIYDKFRLPRCHSKLSARLQRTKVMKKGSLPVCQKFLTTSRLKSIFVLERYDLQKLARRGGLKEAIGFSYNCRLTNVGWFYPFPRPLFNTAWRYRTQTLTSLSAAALQLHIMWCCTRWDDLGVKPPAGGTNTISTESEITTTELLKRRDVGTYCLRSEFLVRKIVVPLGIASVPRGELNFAALALQPLL